ncbi:MAG: ATP-dependent metallopeptidase FtsH/Yme1/Tma family protein [Planctomycetota bacterium]|jgi:cell division protease FtsH
MNERQDNKPPLSDSDQEKKKPMPLGYRRNPFTWLIAGLIILTIWMFFQQRQMANELRLDEFFDHVQTGHVEEVIIRENELTGTFTEEYLSQQEKPKKTFTVQYNPQVNDEQIADLLSGSGVKFKAEPSKDWLWNILLTFLPLIVIILLFYFIFARNLRGGAGGMLMSFGRSKHRLHSKDRVKITFEDVAGIEEAKELTIKRPRPVWLLIL